MQRYWKCALFCTLAAVLPALAARHPDADRIGTRNINRGIYGFPNFFSEEQERQRGAEIDQRITPSVRILADDARLALLEKIAKRILVNSDYRGPLVVKLIRGERVTAFAVMGGYLYVDESILVMSSSEDEVAAVVAHEVAHIAARHGAEVVSFRQFMRSRTAGATSLDIAVRERVRDSELEADELALQYLARTGYDPAALASILDKIKTREGVDGTFQDGVQLIRTRDIDARVRAIERALEP